MRSSNVDINPTTVHEQANRAPGATIYCPGPPATTEEGRVRNLQLGIVAAALTAAVATHQSTIQSPITNQHSTIEQHDMALVGYHDLQGRTAYQPLVRKHGDRWIAYVGHHGD